MREEKISYQNFTRGDLESLLQSAIDGNSNSFTQLSNYIRNISFGYFQTKYYKGKLTNLDDADDLTHNVYLSFAEQYHNIKNIENWLRKVLFLTFINWYKKNKSNPEFSLDEKVDSNSDENQVDKTLAAQEIIGIVNQLSEVKRIIIKSRFWEGLKFSEIAVKLNKNEPAVKKMFYRTMEEIKQKLE